MVKALRGIVCVINSILFIIISISVASANNLSVTNVTLEGRNPSSKTVVIKFDVSWENSWKTKINHDAAWLTFRLANSSITPVTKKLCEVTTSGLNPTGTSISASSHYEIYVPADKKGAFIRPNRYAVNPTVNISSVQVTINFESCGFSASDNVSASVFGLEMVYVPEGAFYAGDYAGSAGALQEGSGDTDPWYISSEASLSVSNVLSDGYYYKSAGNTGENATGSSFILSADFPKGFKAFYAMKYEITEGQWIEFANSLPSAEARANRDVTNSVHKNTDIVKKRNTISCSGSTLVCSTQRPSRAVNFLSWMDVAAFLDWAALRPMTELEFEKMARGPLLSVPGEYAFGTTALTAASALSSGSETGGETVATSGANVNYNNMTLTGGDSSTGAEYAQGPVRVGIFATASSTRETSGAAYYGIMELSGNVAERVVTIGNVTGRDFQDENGDGVLSTAAGYAGNANTENWPGIDAVADRGITGADGSGLRGGGWSDGSSALRISDRSNAAKSDTSALNNYGGRGVRTHDN